MQSRWLLEGGGSLSLELQTPASDILGSRVGFREGYTLTFCSESFFFFFLLSCRTCEILIPQPGIEPGPLIVKAQSSNDQTSRDFPCLES